MQLCWSLISRILCEQRKGDIFSSRGAWYVWTLVFTLCHFYCRFLRTLKIAKTFVIFMYLCLFSRFSNFHISVLIFLLFRSLSIGNGDAGFWHGSVRAIHQQPWQGKIIFKWRIQIKFLRVFYSKGLYSTSSYHWFLLHCIDRISVLYSLQKSVLVRDSNLSWFTVPGENSCKRT